MSISWKNWLLMKEEEPPSPLPLNPSNSADTIENPCSVLPATLRRVLELPSPTPVTPQGLKPRRSVASISDQLNIHNTDSTADSSTQERPITLPSLSYLSSPIVSTSSFYSDCRRLHVAASPVLLPGQARTAVGALVAESHAKTLDSNTFCKPELQIPTRRSSSGLNTSQQSILPPFHDDDLQKYIDSDYKRYSLPPPLSPLLQQGERREDSILSLRSPDLVETFRSPEPISRHFPTISTPEDQAVFPESASLSPLCSVAPSPSSIAVDRVAYRHSKLAGTSQPVTIAHKEYVVGATERLSSDVALQQRKNWNQRRAHEDLFLAIFERLQDDVDSVREIHRQEGEDDDVENECLLAGLTRDTKDRIVRSLKDLLKEMDVTDELFLSSPTDIATVSVPRNDLHDTLKFSLQLTRAAPTLPTRGGDNQRKWKLVPGIKASLGLSTESPCNERRGGDTSVFSLPCDDLAETPMTSNVSISTTITTKTPDARGTAQSYHYHVLDVRRSIALVSKLLHRISAMLLSENLMPQELKKVYLEMQTLDLSSLKSVVESFEIKFAEPMYELVSRSLSDDEREPVALRPLPPRHPPPQHDSDIFFSPLKGKAPTQSRRYGTEVHPKPLAAERRQSRNVQCDDGDSIHLEDPLSFA